MFTKTTFFSGLAGGAASFVMLAGLDAALGRIGHLTSFSQMHVLYLVLSLVHAFMAAVFYGQFLGDADGKAALKGLVFGLFCGILIVRPILVYGMQAFDVTVTSLQIGINILAYTFMGVVIALTDDVLRSASRKRAEKA